jgi:hypothetical protein
MEQFEPPLSSFFNDLLRIQTVLMCVARIPELGTNGYETAVPDSNMPLLMASLNDIVENSIKSKGP